MTFSRYRGTFEGQYRPMTEVDRLQAGVLLPGTLDRDDEIACVEDISCTAIHHTRCCAVGRALR